MALQAKGSQPTPSNAHGPALKERLEACTRTRLQFGGTRRTSRYSERHVSGPHACVRGSKLTSRGSPQNFLLLRRFPNICFQIKNYSRNAPIFSGELLSDILNQTIFTFGLSFLISIPISRTSGRGGVVAAGCGAGRLVASLLRAQARCFFE